MRPVDSALGIFRSPDHDLCVPGRRILRPREPCIVLPPRKYIPRFLPIYLSLFYTLISSEYYVVVRGANLEFSTKKGGVGGGGGGGSEGGAGLNIWVDHSTYLQ